MPLMCDFCLSIVVFERKLSIQSIFSMYLSFLPMIDIVYRYRRERLHRLHRSRIYAIQQLVDAP